MMYIHVDVDNLWIYEKEYGVSLGADPEYIYTQSLPVFLRLIKKYRLKATFMIVGKDLGLKACQDFCKKAIAQGHSIGNHTWSHSLNFATLSSAQQRAEIIKAHQAIKKVTGIAPIGFRGAGYYQNAKILSVLKTLHYQYDASVLPGYAQLLMTLYARMKGKENRNKVFGKPEYFLSPDRPYLLKGIQELPISVLPVLRLPIHTTFAYVFGSAYRRLIIRYIQSRPRYLQYVFHAIDFVDLPVRGKNDPIVPLRYSFKERIRFAESILRAVATSHIS